MRTNYERNASIESDAGYAPRPARRAKGVVASLDQARSSWEPVICPECGADHSSTLTIRMKRSGQGIDARCSDCGAIAARYVAGVWSS